MRKINSNDGNKTIDERHTWTVNNYCMSIEFFHPRNWKHSSSRKWILVQFYVGVDLTAQFLWSWTRRGRRIDGRARDVLQLISTISMCTCTSEKERAANFVRRPVTSRRDKMRALALFWSKKNHWLWNGKRADNSVWRIFIKPTRKIDRKWRSFRLCMRDTCWAFHKQDVSSLSYSLTIHWRVGYRFFLNDDLIFSFMKLLHDVDNIVRLNFKRCKGETKF